MQEPPFPALIPADLPHSPLGRAIKPELETLASEVVENIRQQVPELAVMFEGAAADQARQGFIDYFDTLMEGTALREPAVAGSARRAHQAFVTRAFLENLPVSSLLAAYQVGARVTWSRLSLAGWQAEAAPDQLYLLAKIMFDRLDQISGATVDIYTDLKKEPANLLKERRQRLVRLLIQQPDSPALNLPELAREAVWRIPEKVACVAFDHEAERAPRPMLGLDPDVLSDLDRPDALLLIPSPERPGRDQMLRQALNAIPHALGPTVDLPDAAVSLRLARRALDLVSTGVLPAPGGVVRCDDHLATLQFLNDEDCMRILMNKALAAFSGLATDRRNRLSETLLLWLSTGASLPDIADRLKIHPQTVRYRMRQIDELFGANLYNPDWRFEMELALRGWWHQRLRDKHQKATSRAKAQGRQPDGRLPWRPGRRPAE